jgi:hypothetical protein
MTEFAVLNVPGFKVVRTDDGKNWERIHNGDWATTPYVNPHRWWTGIREYEVAEYISLKSKIKYWTPRQNKRDFSREKFESYKKSFDHLLESYDEDEIMCNIAEYEWATDFLAKETIEMFIF